MIYAIYNRKSEESEERQVQSLTDQLRLSIDLGDRLGLEVPRELQFQEAFSAKEPGRPVFNALMRHVERGEIDGIIAWHPDRLSRNEMDAARICYLLRKGVLKDLKFVNYTFQNSPEGIMMLQMALSQSQYYSSKLSTDVLRGLRSKVEKGWWPHRAPEGYLNDREHHTIVLDPARAPLIQQAFRLLLTGSYTVKEVTDVLNNEWGYQTRGRGSAAGRKLGRTAAYRLFSNIFYAGRMKRKGEILSAAHEPLITLDEYEHVQTIISRGGYQRRTFLFNGFMRCSHCSRAVIGTFTRGKLQRYCYVYYACGNSKCPAGSRRAIREEALLARVTQLLADVAWPPWFGELLREDVAAYIQGELGHHIEARHRLEEQLANLIKRRSSLLDMHLDGSIDQPQFGLKNKELGEELASVEDEILKSKSRERSLQQSIANLANFVTRSEQIYVRGDARQKREVLSLLGTKYSFDNGRVDIKTNPLLPWNLAPLKNSESGSGNLQRSTFAVSGSNWLALRDYTMKIVADLLNGAVFPSLGETVQPVASFSPLESSPPEVGTLQ